MRSTGPILIIGAGAAGLAAARDLSRAGREVIVVEARDRVGGRVFTHRDPESPVPIELGAEFVHGKPPELWQLALAANLELCQVSERRWYFEAGKLSKSRDFWKKIEGLTDEMKSSAADQSLKQFLDSLPDDEETRRAKAMVTRYVEGFHAANIDRIGIRGLVKATEAADSIEGEKAFRFLKGYDSLLQATRAEAESYGATFHLNTIVREIRWEADRVEVDCETSAYPRVGYARVGYARVPRAVFNASAAIITVPLGVLQAVPEDGGISFIPELPDKKRAAISNLAMGNVIKINLRFHERFWEGVKLWDETGERLSFAETGFFHYPDAPFPTWWTQLPIRAPVLVGWVGGPRAESEPPAVAGGPRGSSPSVSAGVDSARPRSGHLTIAQHFSAGSLAINETQAREAGDKAQGSGPTPASPAEHLGWDGTVREGVESEPPAVAGGPRGGSSSPSVSAQAREAGDRAQGSGPTPGSPAEHLGGGGTVREGVESETRQVGIAGRPDDILDRALSSLSLIFNLPAADIRDQLEASYIHDWRNDPFSCGAYSYVPVNGLPAQEILSQPLDNKLFFAGEATAVGHIGTVHGAIQSGQRAAREILES